MCPTESCIFQSHFTKVLKKEEQINNFLLQSCWCACVRACLCVACRGYSSKDKDSFVDMHPQVVVCVCVRVCVCGLSWLQQQGQGQFCGYASTGCCVCVRACVRVCVCGLSWLQQQGQGQFCGYASTGLCNPNFTSEVICHCFHVVYIDVLIFIAPLTHTGNNIILFGWYSHYKMFKATHGR